MELLTNAALLATEAGGGGGMTTNISVPLWVWGVFVSGIVFLLIVDLKLVMREPHAITIREAGWYSAAWIGLGVAFMGVVFVAWGGQAAIEYITAYLIEKSLSMDNVFVWSVLFTYFAVPPEYQHRTLFWGIFGALVMRAIFIFAGVALLETFHVIVYIFGAFLIYTAYKIATSDDELSVDPETNPILKRVRQRIPQTEDYRGEKFFVREDGQLKATPLIIVLITIELTDVLFAVDSIPAVLAVTKDLFLVFSSNAFAILGLRALYFLLAGVRDRFVYLDKGLGIILGYVGIKFILEGFGVHIPPFWSLGIIAAVLTATIVLSLRSTRDEGGTEVGSDLEGETDGEGARERSASDESATGRR